jgi:type 1 glutamine amidotransferase
VAVVHDHDHCATAHLPQRWGRTDEWYNFRAAPEHVRVLASLDTASYSGSTLGQNHPIAWCHEMDGGRAFYTAGGHTNESFREPAFRQHLLGGILWAASRDCAPASP